MGDKTKHLVRVGHEFAAAMSDDTPIITIAKMVTELASALDVQSARSEALAVKLTDVCAENAALKATFDKPQAYLSWHAIPPTWDEPLPCGEYLDVHDTDGHKNSDGTDCWPVFAKPEIETPNTDAWVNEQRAAGRVEGVNFAASRLAAAFNHGFIDKPTAEVYDVVKAVLGAKEELATAPEDGLSGEYAEQALNDWAAQLRGSQV